MLEHIALCAVRIVELEDNCYEGKEHHTKNAMRLALVTTTHFPEVDLKIKEEKCLFLSFGLSTCIWLSSNVCIIVKCIDLQRNVISQH